MDYNKYKIVLEKLMSQYEQKNAAYGYAAHISYDKFGKESYIIRLYDKVRRLKTLREHPEIPKADESIADTLGDAMTYCLMAIGSETTRTLCYVCDDMGSLAHNITVCIMEYIHENIEKYAYDCQDDDYEAYEAAVLALRDSDEFSEDCFALAISFLNDLVLENAKRNAE